MTIIKANCNKKLTICLISAKMIRMCMQNKLLFKGKREQCWYLLFSKILNSALYIIVSKNFSLCTRIFGEGGGGS